MSQLRSNRAMTLSFWTDLTACTVNRFITQRPTIPNRPPIVVTRLDPAAPLDLDALYPALYFHPTSSSDQSGAYLTALSLDLRARLRARDAHAKSRPSARRS